MDLLFDLLGHLRHLQVPTDRKPLPKRTHLVLLQRKASQVDEGELVCWS